MTFADFKPVLGLTFRNPEAAARALIAAGLPMQARWMAALLTVSLSAILAMLSALIFGMTPGDLPPMLAALYSPLAMAGVQFCAIILAAGLMTSVGRLFGGVGRFEDALLLTVWIEMMLLLVQVVQLVASVILPPVAGLLGIVSIVLFLWLTVHFVKALHGFRNVLLVFLSLIGTAFAIGFALSFLAAAFGLLPGVS